MNEETNTGQDFFLRPEHLLVSEEYNVRKYEGGDAIKELERVERLGKTIENEGQLNAVLVTKTKDAKGNDTYTLVAGHRRRRALLILNEQRTAKSLPRLDIRCRLETGNLRLKGLLDNLQRQELTPMEAAVEIKNLREENKWEGLRGTKHIAAYLGLDPQVILEYEKLLGASKEIQESVHEGTLSVQNAITLLDVHPDKEQEVLERAKANQLAKDKKLSPRMKKIRAEKGITEGGTIERPALVKAIRETPGATDKPLTRTRKDLLDTLDQFDAPVYGHPDGAVRMYIRYFVDVYAAGEGTVETLRRRFDAMVAKAPKGIKPEPEPKKKGPKAAKKKAVRKATKKTAKKTVKKAAKKKLARTAVAKKSPVKKTPPKPKAKAKAKSAPRKPNGSSGTSRSEQTPTAIAAKSN